ncbi:MAG: sulfatase [Planctomycetes bacterium]|nr:sulfatase [Planctomycetota bacterium]
MMQRREFVKYAGFSLVGFILPKRVFAKIDQRPNIIYIMSDDHALEAISCYGSWLKDYAKTPNIDRIAKEGMRFDNVCCNNSICSPSRASIITGQYSHKNGVKVLRGKINEDSPCFPAELQKAGYQTMLYGKWHLASEPKGFDDYWVIKNQGRYFDPKFNGTRGAKAIKGYSTDIYTDIALEALDKRDKAKPFCLLLQFKAPHSPFDYPRRLEKLLKDVEVAEPENMHEDVASTSPLLKKKHYSFLNRGPVDYYEKFVQGDGGGDDREKASLAYQHLIHKYIRCITAVDENIGRVLDYLDNEKLADNTVVVYTSDQGYWLGQHGMYDKRLILEESIKMLFVVRYPKEIKASSVCDKICVNVDFPVTLLDFANAAVPTAMQGESMRPLMQGKTPSNWREAVFYCYWAREPFHWGIRSERYTYIRFPGTDAVEIYDLQKDPKQMQNQASNPEYAKAIAMCERKLKRLMREVDIKPEDLPKAITK